MSGISTNKKCISFWNGPIDTPTHLLKLCIHCPICIHQFQIPQAEQARTKTPSKRPYSESTSDLAIVTSKHTRNVGKKKSSHFNVVTKQNPGFSGTWAKSNWETQLGAFSNCFMILNSSNLDWFHWHVKSWWTISCTSWYGKYPRPVPNDVVSWS